MKTFHIRENFLPEYKTQTVLLKFFTCILYVYLECSKMRNTGAGVEGITTLEIEGWAVPCNK